VRRASRGGSFIGDPGKYVKIGSGYREPGIREWWGSYTRDQLEEEQM